jgi:hypothetical protein
MCVCRGRGGKNDANQDERISAATQMSGVLGRVAWGREGWGGDEPTNEEGRGGVSFCRVFAHSSHPGMLILRFTAFGRRDISSGCQLSGEGMVGSGMREVTFVASDFGGGS